MVFHRYICFTDMVFQVNNSKLQRIGIFAQKVLLSIYFQFFSLKAHPLSTCAKFSGKLCVSTKRMTPDSTNSLAIYNRFGYVKVVEKGLILNDKIFSYLRELWLKTFFQ